MVNQEGSDPYKESQERNIRVFYKLKVMEDPGSKNIPHEEEYDDDNYKSIEEKETALWNPSAYNLHILQIFNINMDAYVILEM